jgi:WD40 repeat protein
VLWDAATGERVRELCVDKGPLVRLAFSADGRQLAAACGDFKDIGVDVFDTASGKRQRHLTGFSDKVIRLQFSPDGKTLYTSEREGPVSAWDVVTARRLRQWSPPEPQTVRTGKAEAEEYAREGVLSPDGKALVWRLATDHMRGIREGLGEFLGADRLLVLDAETDEELYRDETGDAASDTVLFSADGKRFAIGGNRIIVRETLSGRTVTAFAPPSEDESLMTFALSPDLRRALIHHGYYRLRLWDLDTSEVLADLRCQPSPLWPRCLRAPQVFAADGSLNSNHQQGKWGQAAVWA